MKTDNVQNNLEAAILRGFCWKLMKIQVDVEVNKAGFHHIDENRFFL